MVLEAVDAELASIIGIKHQDSKSKVNESTYFKKSYNKSCVLGQQHSKGHFLILHLQMYKKLHIWFCSTAKPNGAKLQTDFLFSL